MSNLETANNEMTNVSSVDMGGGKPLSKASPIKNYTQGDKWKLFDVDQECFSKFSKGRKKFERWARFLDMNNETQKSVYDYALRHRKNTIVLRCSETGALRAIRQRSSDGI